MLEAHAVDRPIVALDIEDAASIATVTVDSTPLFSGNGSSDSYCLNEQKTSQNLLFD